MRRLEGLYGSKRFDRRIRVVEMNNAGVVPDGGLDIRIWARRIDQNVMRSAFYKEEMNFASRIIKKDEITQTWLIRWTPSLSLASWNGFRIIQLPAEDTDRGYPIRNVAEVGRAKFLKLETEII